MIMVTLYGVRVGSLVPDLTFNYLSLPPAPLTCYDDSTLV